MHMSLNFLARFIYLSSLEIAICTFLSISLQISPLDVVFSSFILIGLFFAILSLFYLYWKGKATMHPANTFEKRKFDLRNLCCWETRRLRGDLDVSLTKD